MNGNPEDLQKLNKQHFEMLPVGSILVSNCLDGDMPPVHMGRVLEPTSRRPQWKKIMHDGANKRLCRTFTDIGKYSACPNAVRGSLGGDATKIASMSHKLLKGMIT